MIFEIKVIFGHEYKIGVVFESLRVVWNENCKNMPFRVFRIPEKVKKKFAIQALSVYTYFQNYKFHILNMLTYKYSIDDLIQQEEELSEFSQIASNEVKMYTTLPLP